MSLSEYEYQQDCRTVGDAAYLTRKKVGSGFEKKLKTVVNMIDGTREFKTSEGKTKQRTEIKPFRSYNAGNESLMGKFKNS